jgi:hypothetical protein
MRRAADLGAGFRAHPKLGLQPIPQARRTIARILTVQTSAAATSGSTATGVAGGVK